MVTIFKIKNGYTGKCLIGTTRKEDLDEVLKEWMKNCKREKFKEYLISKDYLEYGADSFDIESLFVGENMGEVQEIADSYIIQLNTLEPYGYNKSFVGIRKRSPNYYNDENTTKPQKPKEDSELAEESKKILEVDFRKKAELLKRYGITGISKNNVPQIMAEKETIKSLRKLADQLERYGSIELYEFVPSELNLESNVLKDSLLSLIKKEDAKISKTAYVAIPKSHIQCGMCAKYKDAEGMFFKHPDSNATGDRYIHICKSCIEDYCKNLYASYENVVYVILVLCQLTNVIFVQNVAKMAEKSWSGKKAKPEEIYKYYMSELKYGWLNKETAPNSMLEFRNSNFEGDILSFAEHHPATPKVFIESLNEELIKKREKKVDGNKNSLESKWGAGFTQQEYIQLEQDYEKLEKFLPKKTELHIEALKRYVIYSLKEKSALAKGDLKEVKEWSNLADKAADNAQLKLKQLSENFGAEVDGFAKLVETVEEYDSIIPTLPKARKMPYDDIDFIIWEIVNYIRRLEGKPETTYEEVYAFIDDALTKKMIDSGLTSEQIEKEKIKRNAVFHNLSDNYNEPLWLFPESEEEDDEEESSGGDGEK